jgi:hypothetical protein
MGGGALLALIEFSGSSAGFHVPLIDVLYVDALRIALWKGSAMADIAALLGRLNGEELAELQELGPQGHLPRYLVDALDRAAGGPGAGRGYYVPTGSVSPTGGPHLALRSDVSDWLFGHAHQAIHPGVEPLAGAVEESFGQ